VVVHLWNCAHTGLGARHYYNITFQYDGYDDIGTLCEAGSKKQADALGRWYIP